MNIFISSTYIDLKIYREKLHETLSQVKNIDIISMENFGSVSDDPTTFSLKKVKDCDLFICIIAHRYGYIPKKYNKSITHLEYITAQSNDKKIWVYLIDQSVSVLPVNYDSPQNQEHLAKFKTELEANHVCSYFASPEDLSLRIVINMMKTFLFDWVNIGNNLMLFINDYFRSSLEKREHMAYFFPKDPLRNILNFYIEPKCKKIKPSSNLSFSESEISFLDLINKCIADSKPYIVLSDFGMGKTWALDMAFYRLCKEFMSNYSNGINFRDHPQLKFPVNINLRGETLTNNSNPSELICKLILRAITGTIDEKSKRFNILLNEIMSLFESGNFLVLIDALDETALPKKFEIDFFLTNIGKFCNNKNISPIIIMCRRNLFSDEYQEVVLQDRGFQVHYLMKWTQDMINSYFQKVYSYISLEGTSDELFKIVSSNANLFDIATRPLLCAIIATQSQSFLKKDNLNFYELYESHIEKAILNWQSSKSFMLSAFDIKKYMTEIAFAMFQFDTLYISENDLDEYFAKKFSEFQTTRFSIIADSFVRDIRVNSLLIRENNMYTFCHTSVWEFLVAQKILKDLETGNVSALNIPDKPSKYRSVLNNFLIPFLKSKNRLDLLQSL